MHSGSLESGFEPPVACESPVEESDEFLPTRATASAATASTAAAATASATAVPSVPAVATAAALLPGARRGGAARQHLSQLLQGGVHAAPHPLLAAFPPGLSRAAHMYGRTYNLKSKVERGLSGFMS
jgi:hypothetical protein